MLAAGAAKYQFPVSQFILLSSTNDAALAAAVRPGAAVFRPEKCER